MDGGDLVSLLIWVALGLIGVVSSAIKSKAKKPMDSSRSQQQVPQTMQADPHEYEPDLGSLLEMFEVNKPRQAEPNAVPEYESIEGGPSLEESGWNVDTKEAAIELEGMSFSNKESLLDIPNKSDVQVFEEGQSDIQKMIAKYEALRKELDPTDSDNDIASGEIVSIEAAEEAEAKRKANLEFFDLRKAIIYSEILKRREY
jgi:hypothetical protein